MSVRSLSLVVAAILAATASAQVAQKPGAGNSPAPSPDAKSDSPVRVVKDPDVPVPAPIGSGAIEWKDPTLRSSATRVDGFALDPNVVLFDRPNDTQLWGGSAAYKMCFERSGTTFVPYLGASASNNHPLHFAAPIVTVGGDSLAVAGDVAPTLTGRRVEFDRGGLVEVYDLSAANAEQSFRFERLSDRGAIDISIPVTTALEVGAKAAGLEFVGPDGGITYSQAVAIDAAGERLPLSTTTDGASVRIHVPASFVENARMPLIVDPVIGSTSVFNSDARLQRDADIAYDATNDVYLAVWFRDWSATDSDVFAQRLDSTLAPVGGVITIDFSGDAWEKPRVANKNIGDVFLAVAQVSVDKASPYWIGGRIVDAATGTPGGTIDIEKAGVAGHGSGDKVNPDVGGDPAITGPTYFSVVWERVFAPTDHDIHLKQVETSGSLRTAAPILIANAAADNDFLPSISKSNGLPPYQDQHWAVVWQRDYSATDQDIYGSLVLWDGTLLTVGSSTEFLVDAATRNDVRPTVSSPTTPENGRVYLVAFQGGPTGGDTDIHVRPITLNGRLMSSSPSLQTLEAAGAAQAWPQLAPSVDCDGCRFVVGYHELYQGAGTDLDVRNTLLGWEAVLSSLIVNEARTQTGYTLEAEQLASVVADASGAPSVARPHRFVTIWQNPNGAGNDTIEARRYDGHRATGGFATRATGCGSATIVSSGSAILGEQASFDVNASGALAKVAFFGLPQSVNLAPLCSGCILGSNGSPYPVPLNIPIPCRPVLVGATVSIQGVAIRAGGQPCLNDFALTDTIDLTLQ